MNSKRIIFGVISLLLFLSAGCLANYRWLKKDFLLFSFVQITDTHCLTVDKEPEKPPLKAFFHIGGYKFHWKDTANSFSILENTIRYINSEVRPDFLIHTGDISEGGDILSLKQAKSLLGKLNCPYYTVMGDHDLGCSYSDFNRDRSNCNYAKAFGKRCSSFDHKGWHVIVLGIYPNQEELDWLRNNLARSKECPTILATHRLVVADKFTCWLGKKYSGCSMIMPKAKEVEDILKNYSNVKMVLSGHIHSNFRWNRDGVSFISTAALAEVPHQFRLFRVYPDKIKITLFSANTAKDVDSSHWRRRYCRPVKFTLSHREFRM